MAASASPACQVAFVERSTSCKVTTDSQIEAALHEANRRSVVTLDRDDIRAILEAADAAG
jgi:adenylylsulfate kinase-like enzyme